ncbi:AAA family ATPase [uncultured Sphaerotilus sp.]|uniref:AAA family ATPase n=1 Tax=uncultured Sphaerotilus sp. TaxID=474984 RepID=UPI0030CA3320
MLIHSIKLGNFLSYGAPDLQQAVELGPLNIIIGANGSGKSNLLEAIELLRSAPDQFIRPISEGGGVRDWLWKGAEKTPTASIEVVIDNPKGNQNIRYCLEFTEISQRFQLVDERIENEKPVNGDKAQAYFFYHFNNGRPTLNINKKKRLLQIEQIDLNASILSQRRDPEQYPEVTYLAQVLGNIRLYREWSFGRYTMPRVPQKADLANDFLDSEARNLALILNDLQGNPLVKKRVLTALKNLYDGIDDYFVRIDGGTVQVYFQEGKFTVPATRLSDGTLRYLSLLAILCHPKPPRLVCIEEPELGLHPDVIPTLAELLKEASQRCQIIVTTHSDTLIDAMSDRPDAVLVSEKGEGGTKLTRLNPQQLKPWLEKYRLGQLWTRGEIGGTRW